MSINLLIRKIQIVLSIYCQSSSKFATKKTSAVESSRKKKMKGKSSTAAPLHPFEKAPSKQVQRSIVPSYEDQSEMRGGEDSYSSEGEGQDEIDLENLDPEEIEALIAKVDVLAYDGITCLLALT